MTKKSAARGVRLHFYAGVFNSHDASFSFFTRLIFDFTSLVKTALFLGYALSFQRVLRAFISDISKVERKFFDLWCNRRSGKNPEMYISSKLKTKDEKCMSRSLLSCD